MASSKDFVPHSDADFDAWLDNLVKYVDGKTSSGAWTHIPPEKVAALKQHNAVWHTAYGNTHGPHSPVETAAKNNARHGAESFAREFIAQYLRFDPVTDEDRIAMEIPNHDKTHTPIQTPATRSLITGLNAIGGFRVEIRFQDEATPNSHAIPYGDNGSLLNYAWGTEQISDYNALIKTQLMTHSPWVLTLPPEAGGKFLSCVARRQSKRAELGPWGEIMHVIIG